MPYSAFESTYKELSLEQQMILFNLALSFQKMNRRSDEKKLPKRQFGKFVGKATANFSDDWEMTEEELCGL